MDAAANRNIIAIEGNGAAAIRSIRRKDHTLADVLALHHRAGGQVGHDADLLADEVFRLEPLGNAGQDAALPLAVKNGQVQQLFALFLFPGFHLMAQSAQLA